MLKKKLFRLASWSCEKKNYFAWPVGHVKKKIISLGQLVMFKKKKKKSLGQLVISFSNFNF
jgi:hypothetical protein